MVDGVCGRRKLEVSTCLGVEEVPEEMKALLMVEEF